MHVTQQVKQEIMCAIESYIADWNKYCTDWQPGGACHDPDDGDEHTAMLVTFGTHDGEQWAVQSGDMSYMGPCYHTPITSQISIDCDTDPVEALSEVLNDWGNDAEAMGAA